MPLWDALGAMAELAAGQTAEEDPFRKNRRIDEEFRAKLPHDPGYQPHLPEGYDLAARTAQGLNQGGASWNPAWPQYMHPDAVASRAKARDAMQKYGFTVPDYANDVPQTMASPLTSALVNSAANPIRDRMMWQYNNPTSTLEQGVQVHRGNAGDGGIGPSMAERGQSVQQQMAGDIARWDANQAQTGLAGAQSAAELARGRSLDAQAATQQGQLANDTTRAGAARLEAEARAREIALQEKVVGDSIANKPKPGMLTPESVNDIIQSHAKNSGYLSDLVNQLQGNGALDDPNIAKFTANSLRLHFGSEIDRIMSGGVEGMLARVVPSGGNLMSGFGMWGNRQAGNLPYGRSLQQVRQQLARLFPNLYRETAPPASPPRIPMDFSGGSFGSY